MLRIASEAAALLLASATIAAFVASRSLVTRLTLVFMYALSLRRALRGTSFPRPSWRDTLCSYAEAVRQRVELKPWLPGSEFFLLQCLLRSETLLDAKPALASAYARSGARMQRSFILRLGAHELREAERSLAMRVERTLSSDAGYSPLPPVVFESTDPLVRLLRELGVLLLIPPPAGPKNVYDSIRCTLSRRHFGAPSASFAELADGCAGHWNRPELVTELDLRVQLLARERARDGIDFNGDLARLCGWWVERSTVSPHQRIHLLLERTSFATLIATNEGLHLDRPGISIHELRELCLDRFLNDPEESCAANALAVHLVILSADGYLVCARRSPAAEWAPGLYNTAVNGQVELAPRPGLPRGDYDVDGLVDVVAAGLREAKEELGSHIQIDHRSVVARALALNIDERQVAPFVILEARSPLTFDEIASGHFACASRSEGVFESGGELLGLSLDHEMVRAEVRWLSAMSHRFTRSGLATSLLTLAHIVAPEEIAALWGVPSLEGAKIRRREV